MAVSELTERLAYYGLEPKDPAFRGVSAAIDRAMAGTLERFYGEIGRRPGLSGKFSDSASMERARKAQARHWMSAFSEGLDETFVKRSQHIGGVHARIGLEPQWYVGSYARILDDLITAMIAPGWKALLPWKRAEARRIAALVKVSLLDMDVALSAYFEDVSKKVNVLNEVLGEALSHMASGQLNIDPVELPPEYAKVAADFNSTVAELQQTIGTVIAGVAAISNGSGEIRAASDDLARRTEQQAASLEETAAAVTQAAQRVRETREAASKASGTIRDTNAKAVEGAKIVSEAGTAMSQIEQSSGQITNIIGVIDSIAFQTNLLALNAGVEAARAGESGKGFAVVASEVRALAQRCSDAADEIKSLITGTSAHVATGVDLVSKSGHAFDEIAEAVAVLTRSIEAIATATTEQAEGLSQIETVIGDLDRSTQQNAAMAEQSTAAASSLAQAASTLRDTVGAFQIGAAGQAAMPVERYQPPIAMPPRAEVRTRHAPAVRGNLALKPSVQAAAQDDDWSEF